MSSGWLVKKSTTAMACVLMTIMLCSCAKKGVNMLASTKAALSSSGDSAVTIANYQEKINLTIERFKKVFSHYEEKELTQSIPSLYANDAFLNDRIKVVFGVDNIRNYFRGTFQLISDASFIVEDVAMSQKDAYIRWTMKIKSKGKKDYQEYLGVSQLRFNQEGKIIFHFDSWDFSEILEQAPLIGGIIRYARSKAAH